MTPVQERLDFDAPASRGASRQSDPATSRAAGRSMSGQVLRAQQRLVLEQIHGDATAYEIADALWSAGRRIQQNVVARRLGELHDLGLVRLTGATRPGGSARPCMVYELSDTGREALS